MLCRGVSQATNRAPEYQLMETGSCGNNFRTGEEESRVENVKVRMKEKFKLTKILVWDERD